MISGTGVSDDLKGESDMRKWKYIMLLTCCLALVLSACGNQTAEANSGTEASTEVMPEAATEAQTVEPESSTGVNPSSSGEAVSDAGVETEIESESMAEITRLECSHESGPIYGALDSYFSAREKVINGEEAELIVDPEFSSRIQKWSDDMSLDIQAAGVRYGVEEVWYNSESLVKLLVYESVVANYVCRGYTQVETFGYGWEHVIELTNTDEGWLVTCDSYYSDMGIFNGEVGSEEDVSRLIAPKVHWVFRSGNIPEDFGTPDDEFTALVQAEIDAQAAALGADKDDWFADCNGEKLQRIASANQELNRPDSSSDIIFYQAEEGESLEDILAKMLEAMLEPFMSGTEEQKLAVTEYQLDLENMEILDKEAVDDQIIEAVWKAWQCDQQDYDWTFEEYLPKRLYYLEGLKPLGEDMWLIPSGQYILVRDGMVYRLQRAGDMGYGWTWAGAYWKE